MGRKLCEICLYVFCTVVILFACDHYRLTHPTPKQFLNIVKVDSAIYKRDNQVLINQLRGLLLKHKEPFNAYSDSAKLKIDTIIYNKEMDKIIALVIINYTLKKELRSDEKQFLYYDGTAYIGKRNGDTLDISMLGPVYTNGTDLEKFSKIMRSGYFREFARDKSTGKYDYKYNLNDVRFWTLNVWNKIDDEMKGKAEFEELKKAHPERVYEPQKQTNNQ